MRSYRIPKGCAWKLEASCKNVYSVFGHCYELKRGANVRTDKKIFVNTNIALLSISFYLSGGNPKYRSFVLVVKAESNIINFAALLWEELTLLKFNKIPLQPPQTVDA